MLAENVSLCTAIIDVARVAAARLTVRDAAHGYIKLAPPQRAALQTQADRWVEVTGLLLDGWRGLRRSAARHLVDMVPDDDDLILLALVAAPQLDRTLARAYRGLSGLTEPSVGLLLDLAAPQLEQRLDLVGRLHADRALRAAALIEIAGNGPAMLTDPVDVSGSTVAALRGERIAPPGPSAAEDHQLDDELIPALEQALRIPRWLPGIVTILSGPPPERAAVMTLRAALDRKGCWHIQAPVTDATVWCRDAALADVNLGVTAEDLVPTIRALRPVARTTQAAVAIACDVGDSGVAHPEGVVVSTQVVRRSAQSGISQRVPAGPIRSALETLGL